MANDPNLMDRITENTVNALVSFNNDMKALALNAYQLEDLLDLSLQENDAFIEWFGLLEEKTTNTETKLFKVGKGMKKFSKSL